MPGTDPAEALRLVLGELPDLPHLPELPGRGAGADMIGRTAALLVDLQVDLQPPAGGWSTGRAATAGAPRACWRGPRRAGGVRPGLRGAAEGAGRRAVDAGRHARAAPRRQGACPTPARAATWPQSLAEGVRRHLAEVRRRVPGAAVVLQLDEPSLPAVLRRQVPTASGFGTLRAVEEQVVEPASPQVLAAAPARRVDVVHCCAPTSAVRAAARGRGAARSRSTSRCSPTADDDALGEAVEAGRRAAGSVSCPRPDAAVVDLGREASRSVRALWRRLGFAAELLPGAVVRRPRPAGSRAPRPRTRARRCGASARRRGRSPTTRRAEPASAAREGVGLRRIRSGVSEIGEDQTAVTAGDEPRPATPAARERQRSWPRRSRTRSTATTCSTAPTVSDAEFDG